MSQPTPSRPLTLAVVMGGPSPEHEVSLRTASVILEALDRERFSVWPFLLTRDLDWIAGERPLSAGEPFDVERLRSGARLGRARGLDLLGRAEAAFLAMHGAFGEDGVIQGLLEFLGVPYTGSGVAGSAFAMDKVKTKELLRFHGIPTADWRVVRERELAAGCEAVVARLRRELGDRLVVKSPLLGSSFGIAMADTPGELAEGLAMAVRSDGRALVEPRMQGVEVTCAVLAGKPGEPPRALPPTEIIPPEGRFFDHEAKYTPGMTREVTPPRLAAEVVARIQAIALSVHDAVGLAGLSRTDMFVLASGDPVVLEVNTIPGMTRTSLYPQAAAAVGIAFPDLLAHLVEVAVAEFHDRRRRMEECGAPLAHRS